MRADSKSLYPDTSGPRIGMGIYRCHTLYQRETRDGVEMDIKKFDHLSDEGQTTLCNRKLEAIHDLQPSKYTWDQAKSRCPNCEKEADKIRTLQKTLRKHTKENSCRGEARESCPACSDADNLREIELPKNSSGENDE